MRKATRASRLLKLILILTEERNLKEVLAKHFEQEEALQKQEAEAVDKFEKHRVKKELIANVVKKEKLIKEAV